LSPGLDADIIAELGVAEMECDVVTRRLSWEYQDLGLHSAIRAEIIESSQPKLKKDGPGMRYEYGREPDPKQWEKISVHFPNGLTVRAALAAESGPLRLRKVVTFRAKRERTVYEVIQQIGTADKPKTVTYKFNAHRELPEDAVIKRWSWKICDDYRWIRSEVIPTMDNHGLEKPVGQGTFAFDITWRSTPDGIQVCHFLGDNVNERLILPRWLIDRRLSVTTAQKECDQAANKEITRLTRVAPAVDERQGVSALESYCASNPNDSYAAGLLAEMAIVMHRARKDQQKAIRCIEKIYETVAFRVCSRHSHIVVDDIDLSTIKRYDTRDLLRYDPLTKKSREYLAAVSPGKLTALLKGYGLARAKSLTETLVPSRESDHFSSYVSSLAIKTGTKTNRPSHRSQHERKTAEK
jgi:hypothetical protein